MIFYKALEIPLIQQTFYSPLFHETKKFNIFALLALNKGSLSKRKHAAIQEIYMPRLKS